MGTHIRCIQSLETQTVRKKLTSSLIRTHSVRFIGGYPDINDRRKGPDTVGELGRDPNCAWRMASLKAQDHGNAYAERLAWEGGNRFANSIGPFFPDTGTATTRVRPGDDAHAWPGAPGGDLQRMWAERAVCRLLAQNVGSLALIVSLSLSLLAPNVSRKRPLFAGPGAAVCRPLHLACSSNT